MSSSEHTYVRAAWAWLLAWTLFRLFYAGAFLLVPDETNYWQWSRHLAWGFHDQAPMIAWVIRLSTQFLGHTELGVRLPSILAMATASGYLILLAQRFFGPRVALHTALLSQGILEFNVGSLLATPDGLQAAAWAGACFHVALAYEKGAWRHWMLGGIWFGFGMLSKYTMVIFLPCVFFYGLFSVQHRQRLTNLKPYVGVLTGIIMFFPVIWWNAQNSWNSVRHVAYLGGVDQSFALHYKYLGDYIASQAALVSPLGFILVIVAWVYVLRKKYAPQKWIYPFLFYTSFPMIAGFAILSLHTRVYGNWPGAGYLTVAVLAAAYFRPRKTADPHHQTARIWKRLYPWALGTGYLFTIVVLAQVVWPVLPLPPHLDRSATETVGWDSLGKTVARMQQEMPDPEKTFLFGLRYQIASELAFYTPGNPQTVSINKWRRPNVYDYWFDDADLIGMDAVGVTFDSESHNNRLNQIFERVEAPVKLDIFRDHVFKKEGRGETPVQTFYLYRAYGFKGGLRWVPPARFDIRATN